MTNGAALDPAAVRAAAVRLRSAGVRTVVGTTVNAAGLTLAKSVPVARLDAFAAAGMGASPVWHAFCVDAAIAFTDAITAVGDLRLRLDADSVRDLGGGIAWGPVDYYFQDGTPDPRCARGLLGAVVRRLAAERVSARVGHELEFVLVAPDGSALPDPAWIPYGASGLVRFEAFLADLHDATAAAGVELEQVHAEYGRNQIELSLPPAPPTVAADTAVLAKFVIGRVARRHAMLASFSPVPFAGSVGNGAHQHFSLYRDGQPLFERGAGPHGVTDDGAAAIGGILAALPHIQGLLTGSALSGIRLQPGLWSGVHACWGLENREAAVRLVQGGTANPHGANVEVKIIDPSANVYSASAVLLAAALDGILVGAELPAEVPDDPSKLSPDQLADRGIALLPGDAATVIDALDGSQLARRLVGDAIVDATVATRRYEHRTLADLDAEELADRLRLVWSI